MHSLVTAALAPFIHEHGVPDRLLAKGFTNMFNSLARSILGQQLAVKAASVIIGRFMNLCQVSVQVHITNPAREALNQTGLARPYLGNTHLASVPECMICCDALAVLSSTLQSVSSWLQHGDIFAGSAFCTIPAYTVTSLCPSCFGHQQHCPHIKLSLLRVATAVRML